MKLFKIFEKKLKIVSFFKYFCVLILINSIYSCAVPEFAKPKKIDRNKPVNAKERARKNVEEGRGVSLGGMIGGNKSTNYEFSTSNPLWRASLEIIDFMPLSTVDYSGGIIITDWYNDSNNSKESIKITIRFLSNEVRTDSIKIIVHNKKCSVNENCNINEIDTKLKFELQKSILTKAASFDLEKKNKK
jgi:hypothetical protein